MTLTDERNPDGNNTTEGEFTLYILFWIRSRLNRQEFVKLLRSPCRFVVRLRLTLWSMNDENYGHVPDLPERAFK